MGCHHSKRESSRRRPTVSPRQHNDLPIPPLIRPGNGAQSTPRDNRAKSSRDYILVLGLDGSGKTTIVEFLHSRHFVLCGPTPIHPNLADIASASPSEPLSASPKAMAMLSRGVSVNNHNMFFLDPSGKIESRKAIWPLLIQDPAVCGIVFVVDVRDPIVYPLAVTEISNIMRDRPRIPLLIVGNVRDEQPVSAGSKSMFRSFIRELTESDSDLEREHPILSPEVHYRSILSSDVDRHSLLEGISWLWSERDFEGSMARAPGASSIARVHTKTLPLQHRGGSPLRGTPSSPSPSLTASPGARSPSPRVTSGRVHRFKNRVAPAG